MFPIQNIWIDILFIGSVIIIWFMIVYQITLFICGYLYGRDANKEKIKINFNNIKYPFVSVLVPAHNEEKVIAKTIEAMLNLDYPSDKIEIIIINDCSSDKTYSIADQIALKEIKVKLVDIKPPFGAKGKSSALNYGIKYAKGEVIAIYDADNVPERDSLKYLIAKLTSDNKFAAVIGKFRPYNKNKNLITRFINIETLSFQWIVQAGRFKLLNISTLPGTNFVMYKDTIEKLGGWDEQALTEDAELSLRIYRLGKKIAFIPYAITWEQEPEKFKTWINQRTRWVRGNNYVLSKFLKDIFSFKDKLMAIELLYNFSLYYIFLAAILLSDLFFILGFLNIIAIPVPGPYLEVWLVAYMFFTIEILFSLSREDEDTPKNLFLTVLMYFTYCQFWIIVVIRALYLDLIKKEKKTWKKTERFEVN